MWVPGGALRAHEKQPTSWKIKINPFFSRFLSDENVLMKSGTFTGKKSHKMALKIKKD